jgi:peptidoglycan-associated lipoprotein
MCNRLSKMSEKYSAHFAFMLLFTGVVLFAGCHKRVASAPPPPPAPAPAPAAPTVTLNASPSDIAKGGSTTLSWSSTNASRLTLTPDVGSVDERGSRQISPGASTTYTITAMGNGGNAEASTRVTVNVPPPPAASAEDLNQMFQEAVKDAFFDYDKSDIRADARESLQKNAVFLNAHREIRFTIEGHCDERGSEEYNIGLGDRRANAAKKYMVSLGIPDDRIQTTSYGKERPFCTEHTEACWQQNRRAHFVMNR